MATFALTLVAARGRRVGKWEHVATRRLNRLPDALHGPVWLVMQSGALGAPLVAGGAATLAGRPGLAARLAGSGVSAYLLAKGVKRVVRRGRPGELVTGIRIRGHPASGHGYVSGHAAVSMALATEALPLFTAKARPVPIATASVVALARVYVGAHLPLDALGGAALGWAVSRTASELRSHHRPTGSTN
ncbi:MAG: phosphatase PAP2 family protein [Pseudonocardiales bacterium]